VVNNSTQSLFRGGKTAWEAVKKPPQLGNLVDVARYVTTPMNSGLSRRTADELGPGSNAPFVVIIPLVSIGRDNSSICEHHGH